MKIAIVMGTRPEAIKLMPVYLNCLRSLVYQPILISTGQHGEVLNQILDYFEVKLDYQVSVLEKGGTLSSLTSKLFQSIEKIFHESCPDLVMVQGDTCTAWVAAMVAFYNKIPLAHVEAGLRTGNKFSPFPEELYRKQITDLADIHFTPTSQATHTLKKAGVTRVHQVGNTVIDSLHLCLKRETDKKVDLDFLGTKDITGSLVLVTCHRRENIAQMVEIAGAINALASRNPELIFLIPIHMNPRVQNAFGNSLDRLANVVLMGPLPYPKFIMFLSHSYIVISDSGGVVEEAAGCNVPVLIIRESTERNEAVASGCAVIAGNTRKSIIDTFNGIHNNPDRYLRMRRSENPFGDGHASQQIIEILENDLAVGWLSKFVKKAPASAIEEVSEN